MEDVAVIALAKFIVAGVIVSAFLMGMACVLKAIAWALKAAEEEAGRQEGNDDK